MLGVYFPHLSPIVVSGVVLRLKVTQEGLAGKRGRGDSLHPALKIQSGAPPVFYQPFLLLCK